MRAKREEDLKEQEKLMARVTQLEHSLEECSEKLMYWRGKYNEMEDAYERERQSRRLAEDILRKEMADGMGAVVLPSRRPLQDGYMAEPAPKIDNGSTVADFGDVGCGNCSAETRCQCIDEAFKMDNVAAEPEAPGIKRPHSPQSATDNKRHRLSSPEPSSEIDFTAQFSTRRPPTLTTSTSISSSLTATAQPDPCGFCSDGTTCLCAELAKERPDRTLKVPAFALPTPPESAITTTTGSASNPCINGPGSCTQCRSNPTSTLFCKSLAANRPANAPNEFSPTARNTTAQASTAKQTTQASTLNCADAFTVLSRHPGFDQATSELTTWIPHLSTVPSATTAFDIEAASVMGVLKLFDRRFGTGSAGHGNATPTGSRAPLVSSSSIDGRFPAVQTSDGRGSVDQEIVQSGAEGVKTGDEIGAVEKKIEAEHGD